jgi:hypothetical protein
VITIAKLRHHTPIHGCTGSKAQARARDAKHRQADKVIYAVNFYLRLTCNYYSEVFKSRAFLVITPVIIDGMSRTSEKIKDVVTISIIAEKKLELFSSSF